MMVRARDGKIFGIMFFALALACVSDEGTFAQESYESPGDLTLGTVLPDVQATTPLYHVEERVANDGIANHFVIYGDSELYQVAGNELARERVREINAMAALSEIENTDAFKDGLKAAGKSTLNSVKTAVTAPVATLKAIPEGVNRLFGNIYRSSKDERRGQYQDSAAKEAIGFSKVKRAVAFEVGVDPYSSNAVLQEKLTDVAWASYAGGMSLSVLKAVVLPEPVGKPLFVTHTSVKVSALIRDESPESLQKINKEKLESIGAGTLQIEAFLENGWYSPSRQTILVEALTSLQGVEAVAQYLDRAIEAASEEQAFFMQRNAELLSAYHVKQSPLKSVLYPARIPVAETTKGGLVCLLAVDHLAWTERVATTASAIRSDLPVRLKDTPIELGLSGNASEKALGELKALGFNLKLQVDATLLN